MANTAKKLAKKKEREREVAAKLLRRRTATQKAAKEEKLASDKEYERRKQYNRANAAANRVEQSVENEHMTQLQRNIKILEALEKEYDKQKATEKLEEEKPTMSQALQEAVLPKRKKQKASADVEFRPNPEN